MKNKPTSRSRIKTNPFNKYRCEDCKMNKAIGCFLTRYLCPYCISELKGESYTK